jgi:hypothetical protein
MVKKYLLVSSDLDGLTCFEPSVITRQKWLFLCTGVIYIYIFYVSKYTGCFTTLGHNCRRWFPRALWCSHKHVSDLGRLRSPLCACVIEVTGFSSSYVMLCVLLRTRIFWHDIVEFQNVEFGYASIHLFVKYDWNILKYFRCCYFSFLPVFSPPSRNRSVAAWWWYCKMAVFKFRISDSEYSENLSGPN